jgi:cell division protease FtsH
VRSAKSSRAESLSKNPCWLRPAATSPCSVAGRRRISPPIRLLAAPCPAASRSASGRRRDSCSGSERGPSSPPSRSPAAGWWIVALLGLLLAWALSSGDLGGLDGRVIPYSEFKRRLAAGEIRECRVEPDFVGGTFAAAGADGKAADPQRFRAVRIEDPSLVEDLEAAGIEFTGVRPSPFLPGVFLWVLPLGGLLLFGWLLSRRMGSVGRSALTFGKSRARLVADVDTGVDFDDVAGCEEAKVELREVVDFLRHPRRYQELGAKIPKGILLVGPPGTGKTLLARAIAGEAKVPFFSISGSEFVEMFVGVGAARVRDLFDQAKVKAPCIVFVDELDAIGRQRGVHIGVVNDEREQTLNQLLVEMDGFEPNAGVILLAATNRPDVLDRALLRPGRFDRQVVLDAPNVDEREAILRVHARGKPLSAEADLAAVARATPGFAGADLANALNEAALLAARRGAAQITKLDLEEAVEKVVAGPERKSRRMEEDEKRRVAVHETGHAVVAHFCEHADPVHKISIVPRGQAALGYTLQLPERESHLQTRAQLEDRITGLLGGRAAEELLLGEGSTGAADDLKLATGLARRMVCLYGMGKSVGLMHCAQETEGRFLAPWTGGMQRDCSEATAREIDEEVKKVLDRLYGRARAILVDHRESVERIARTLVVREILDRAAFEKHLPPAGKGLPSVVPPEPALASPR